MTIKQIVAVLSATTMAVAPFAASAHNAASSLSIAPVAKAAIAARASAKSGRKNKVLGAGVILPAVAVIGVIAGVVFVSTDSAPASR
ncbi:MAG: hypothetical protein B7Y45_01510 [Sphingomonas sp. 28-66-16]|nr:MAG: hypothetical protein B7Y45_01510 [Sphingomonas sp. 28-66-16]